MLDGFGQAPLVALRRFTSFRCRNSATCSIEIYSCCLECASNKVQYYEKAEKGVDNLKMREKSGEGKRTKAKR